jgi:hypothetical protein
MAAVTLHDLRKAFCQTKDVKLRGGTRPEELAGDLLAVKNALNDLRRMVGDIISYLEHNVKP